MARFELLDEIDLPFPLGGCFGYWGYDLKNFTEPKLPRRAVNDLELPDCHVGFYDSLVVFDHQLGKVFVVSTGLECRRFAQRKTGEGAIGILAEQLSRQRRCDGADATTQMQYGCDSHPRRCGDALAFQIFPAPNFIAAVERAQRYIRAGDIYQVNLSHD